MIETLLSRSQTDFPHQLSFVFAGVRFLMLTDELDAITEIEDYISPFPDSFDAVVDKQIEIRFVIDEALEASIRNRCLPTGKEIIAKTDITYRRVETDSLVFYSSDQGEKPHSIVITGNTFAVVGATRTVSSIRGPLRVIREVALRKLENQGGCFTHAAAVSFQEGKQGALIIGDSGAGKSTTMWQLLSYGGAEFITNDRSITLLDEQTLHVFGWPMCLRLGMGTVKATLDADVLRDRTFRREQVAGLWEQEVSDANGAERNWAHKDKLEITPKEAAELTGTTVRSRAVVSALFFPQLKIGAGPIRLVPAGDEYATDILRSNLREPEDEDYRKGWLGQREVTDEFLIEKCAAISAHLLSLPKWIIQGDPRFLQESLPDLLASFNDVQTI